MTVGEVEWHVGCLLCSKEPQGMTFELIFSPTKYLYCAINSNPSILFLDVNGHKYLQQAKMHEAVVIVSIQRVCREWVWS